MKLLVAGAIGLIVLVLYLALIQAYTYRKSRERIHYLRHFAPEPPEFSQHNQGVISLGQGTLGEHQVKITPKASKPSLRTRLKIELRSAGVKISLQDFALVVFLAVVTFSFLVELVVPNYVAAFFISLFTVFLAVRYMLRYQSSKRRDLFEAGLPDFLIVLASSLRSGLPLVASLETISQRGDGQVEREIRQATSDIALGLDPSSALLEISKRMQSLDMSWVVLAITIQRESGGNLSTILESVAETVQQRGRIRREVATLSAESRLSAAVLVALPILVFIFFYISRRSYVSIFWTTNYGAILLMVMVALIAIGTYWMRKIVKIKI